MGMIKQTMLDKGKSKTRVVTACEMIPCPKCDEMIASTCKECPKCGFVLK